MRRCCAFALALGLCFAVAVCGAEDAPREPYLLWGIPFGVTPDEFVDAAYERNGVGFETDGVSAELDQNQSVLFLGHKAGRIYAHFTDGELSSVLIEFDFEVNSPGTGEAEDAALGALLAQYADIVRQYESHYGEMTGYRFRVQNNNGPGAPADYAFANDAIDFDAVLHAMLHKAAAECSVHFRNISVAIHKVAFDFQWRAYIDIQYTGEETGAFGDGDRPEKEYRIFQDVSVGL